MMSTRLEKFFSIFRTFSPPCPYRGRGGANWLVSGEWGRYMTNWLHVHFVPRFEYPVGRRRLDAALWWPDTATAGDSVAMDYAVEWEWDHNKVHRDFPFGDFVKVVRDVDAQCGIAIVHTRVDGNYHLNRKADETLERLRDSLAKFRTDGRPVGVIEVRRVEHDKRQVGFRFIGYDMESDVPHTAIDLGSAEFSG